METLQDIARPLSSVCLLPVGLLVSVRKHLRLTSCFSKRKAHNDSCLPLIRSSKEKELPVHYMNTNIGCNSQRTVAVNRKTIWSRKLPTLHRSCLRQWNSKIPTANYLWFMFCTVREKSVQKTCSFHQWWGWRHISKCENSETLQVW